MTEYKSPVPAPPALEAKPAEIYTEIYPMPAFTICPTADLEASKRFWLSGLGFIDLFSVPGQITHLRRWAFQDVLLVPGETPSEAPGISVSFSCVLSQIAEIAEACERLSPGCTDGPREMPWNSIELTVITPENTRVVMTAARPLDRDGAAADFMRELGIEVPEA